jgi:3-mercaptopyruvate sulfurtransferase SseA
MHIHELNPWRTLIVLSVFAVLILVGFFTIQKPAMEYDLNLEESLLVLNDNDACFYPWQLEGVIKKEATGVVLFDIRDKFTYGQGHIPNSENISAFDLTTKDNIKRLDELKEQNVTVVLYGDNQLQANGPWMLFRQAGYNNVKVLLGGYRYYTEHKENLAATKTDDSYKKGVAHFDFAKIASQSNTEVDQGTTPKKKVVIRRRKKEKAASGGC